MWWVERRMAQGCRGNSLVLVARMAGNPCGHIYKVYAEPQLIFSPVWETLGFLCLQGTIPSLCISVTLIYFCRSLLTLLIFTVNKLVSFDTFIKVYRCILFFFFGVVLHIGIPKMLSFRYPSFPYTFKIHAFSISHLPVLIRIAHSLQSSPGEWHMLETRPWWLPTMLCSEGHSVPCILGGFEVEGGSSPRQEKVFPLQVIRRRWPNSLLDAPLWLMGAETSQVARSKTGTGLDSSASRASRGLQTHTGTEGSWGPHCLRTLALLFAGGTCRSWRPRQWTHPFPLGTQGHFTFTYGPWQSPTHQDWSGLVKPSRLSRGGAARSPLCIFWPFVLFTWSRSDWIYKWLLNWITSRWMSVLDQMLAMYSLDCIKWEFSEFNFSLLPTLG